MQMTSFFLNIYIGKPNVGVWWMDPTMMGTCLSLHLIHFVIGKSGWNVLMEDQHSRTMAEGDFVFLNLICRFDWKCWS